MVVYIYIYIYTVQVAIYIYIIYYIYGINLCVHVLYQLQWYGRVAGINLSQILHACNSANPNWLSARSGLEDINQSKDIHMDQCTEE